MTAMEIISIYIIKTILISGLFWLFYQVLLSHETYFTLNRIYLLFSITCSLLTPLLPIPVSSETFAIKIPEIEITNSHLQQANSREVLSTWFLIIPAVISAILLIRLIIQIIYLIYKGKHGIPEKSYKIITSDKEKGIYSFFHYIFIPSSLAKDTDLQIILAHEHVHICQYHSIDKLACEIFVAILWFNPFAWLLRKSITETHEFLADRNVLKTSCNSSKYLSILYGQLLPVTASGPIAGFTKSITFKRFKMLTKTNSSKTALLKYALITPVIGVVLTFIQTNPIIAQQKKPTGNNAALMTCEQMPVFTEGSFRSYVARKIKYPKESLKNKIHGYVVTQFIVNTEGKVVNVQILQNTSNDPLLANEVMQVIQNSPSWKPGTNQGKPINLQLTIPVKFNL
jgi:TonB family protein